MKNKIFAFIQAHPKFSLATIATVATLALAFLLCSCGSTSKVLIHDTSAGVTVQTTQSNDDSSNVRIEINPVINPLVNPPH